MENPQNSEHKFGSKEGPGGLEKSRFPEITAKKVIWAVDRLEKDFHLDIPNDPELFRYIGNEYSSSNQIYYIYGKDNKRHFTLKTFSNADEGSRARFDREINTRDSIGALGIFPFTEGSYTYFTPEVILQSPADNLLAYRYFDGDSKPDDFLKHAKNLVGRLNSVRGSTDRLKSFPTFSKYYSETPEVLVGFFEKNMAQIENTLRHIEKTGGRGSDPNVAKYIRESRLIQRINQRAKEILDQIDPKIMSQKVKPEDLVFDHGDIAISNLMVAKNGKDVAVIDLESAGWNYWADMFDFLYHPQVAYHFDQHQRTMFLEKMAKEMRLNPTQIAELNLHLALNHLLWISKKMKGFEVEENIGWRTRGYPDYMTYVGYVKINYLDDVERMLRDGPLQIGLGSKESVLILPLSEMPKILEAEIEKFAAPLLAEGRKEWDEPHTKAVVYYAEKIAGAEGIDVLVLKTAAYLHDLGYFGTFSGGDSASYEAVKTNKELHMVKGAEMAREFLNRPEITKFYTTAQKERVIHLVSVHDKLEELKDKDEIAFMEADTLGQIDVKRVKPTFEGESAYKYVFGFFRRRFGKFKTETGKELRDILYPQLLDYLAST